MVVNESEAFDTSDHSRLSHILFERNFVAINLHYFVETVPQNPQIIWCKYF